MSNLLHLHVHDNQVWYIDGPGLPQCSQKTPAEFVQGRCADHADSIRLLGLKDNVQLILLLTSRSLAGNAATVQVASPRFAGAFPDDPRQTLQSMRSAVDTPSRGGWHEMTMLEAASYSLADIPLEDEERRWQVLQMHPVWPRLTILPTIDPAAVGRLLGLLRDPRFFVDPDEPDRRGRLQTYLGLEPKIQKAVLKGEEGLLENRNRLVRQCWCREDSLVAGGHPSAFLQREEIRHQPFWKGVLRASQLFLQYLQLSWLDVLYPNPNWGEPLFDPGHFFRTPMEAEWFAGAMT